MCLISGRPVLAAETYKPAALSRHPNLAGQMQQPLRYRPDGQDFVIRNGREFFNRPLYGGNTAFRADGGDLPEFSLYLPGRGGNLRLGIRTAAGTKWLHEAASITTRYRPGELEYEIADDLLGADGRITVVAVAYAASEGLGIEVRGRGLGQPVELLFAFGPGNGERGRRDGDIGTENVPISQYFQFAPAHAAGSRIELAPDGFNATSASAVIGATVSPQAVIQRADARQWNDLAALLGAGESADVNVAVGRVPLAEQGVQLGFVVTGRAATRELGVYVEVGARSETAAPSAPARALTPVELPRRLAEARAHFEQIRASVRIDTPDPYLNAAMGALNVTADALWDQDEGAIMHGAIAWRTKLLGWRGPYALDTLGRHDRARSNLDLWAAKQNTSAIAAQLPPADPGANLSRNEPGLHSNGDLSKSHYDMNTVFIDGMLRHLLWTGDVDYAKSIWPVLERHLAWERRLFRREYGPDKLPLYEAYAVIWASDDLYYNGGGATHSSAYQAWHNQMAARIAALIGKDPKPYQAEAELIHRAMRKYLWMPERGAFAEYRDLLGTQALHPSYGLWSFYHTLDSAVPDRFEAARMAADLDRHLRPIPVTGPGVPADRAYRVLPTSDWMPYSWSINNVVMGEVQHTALAYWQAGRGDTAFDLAKGAVLASLYMGITPGNIGTMNYLDVYRREAQRDFADGAGVMSRMLVEGLFGVRPDALTKTLTVRPGLPRAWEHASMEHPDLSFAYRREGLAERWSIGQHAARFTRLVLEVPVLREHVVSVRVDGKPARWTQLRDSVLEPRLQVEIPFGQRAEVEIRWRGAAIDAGATRATAATGHAGFTQYAQGAFSWWRPTAAAKETPKATACAPVGDGWTNGTPVQPRHVDLAPWFNDRVTEIFKPGKYQSPRSPYVSLALPSQGLGAWAGHVNEMARIDDAGLRAQGGTLRLPNGLSFATPSAAGAANVVFTSQWDNYPRQTSIPLQGQASRAFLLMAGSTNYMQSRFDNGEIIVSYIDGTQQRVALRNPDNWWPIEQDYFIDDYQFPYCGRLPIRVDLKTAKVRTPQPQGQTIDGGSATVLEIPLDKNRQLKSLTVRTLANEVVIGLLAATLDQRNK
ncbi:DUF4450 domain-containing protein [Duganella sp. SAP-35]|uniref:DUF4450 domain-containing protein n=2 Tax=Duganella aceris TaxID=2703883 RepID=A0ABX0FQ30_9BURK|nr:DUF4450 domain-containing protein [Duganella aceris]